MLQIKALWFKSFKMLILTVGKSYSEKNVSAACLITKSKKREPLQKSERHTIHFMLYRAASIVNHFIFSSLKLPRHIPSPWIHSPLRSDTWGPVPFWVSVGSGEGDKSAHLGLRPEGPQSRTGAPWFSRPLCSLLLGAGRCWEISVDSPGIPRSERPLSCFRVLSLNTRMFFPTSVGKLTNQTVVWNPSQKRCHRVALWRHDRKSPGWVIWFISGWLGSSEIYSYTSLSSY